MLGGISLFTSCFAFWRISCACVAYSSCSAGVKAAVFFLDFPVISRSRLLFDPREEGVGDVSLMLVDTDDSSSDLFVIINTTVDRTAMNFGLFSFKAPNESNTVESLQHYL